MDGRRRSNPGGSGMVGNDPRVVLIVGLCLWELIALTSGLLPSLTSLAHRIRTRRYGRLLLWLAVGWLLEHLIGEGR